jgi:hypothetical protein
VALEHSRDERTIVEKQLGRATRGRWAVAARCHLGVPMVIENHPRLDDGTPFPTLFWLTCPVLVRRASRIEAEGGLSRTTARLEASSELRARLADAIERYKMRRASHEAIDDSGPPPGGGPDRVKCLHAHIAHELADPGNPVGAAGLAQTGWPDCRIPCAAAGEDE